MKKLISKRWVQYFIPLVIWFLLLVLPFLVGSNDNNFPQEMRRRFIIDMIASNFLLLCIFYLHTYLLYPLINKKAIWYTLGLIVMLALYLYAKDEIHHFGHWENRVPHKTPFEGGGRRGRHKPSFDMGGPNFFPLISASFAILCSFCYRMILDNRVRQQLLKERETSHLKTELNFLRSQISPHFMFNVLNNLVSLARKKSDELEPAIVNLSHLMRYMLYESDDHRVILSKEVEYIQSYINLQMLRFGSTVKTNIDIAGNTDLYTIEPMLLIPFVENAFKHGTGMIEDAVISISLSVDEKTRLMQFNVINGINTLDVSKDKSSGIGISNVRRRLAILYPEKHDLQIVNTGDTFTVSLSIQLAE